MRTRIKICGITNLNDALTALEVGADALGFVFFPKSPRYIEPEQAREIIRELPPLVTVVGVFVDEHIDRVREIVKYCSLALLQLHGTESPEYCEWYSQRVIKVFRVKDRASIEEIKKYSVSGVLLDSYSDKAYGGTGSTFDWSLAREVVTLKPVVLAGGLTAENVGQAIAQVRPYGVDVSSGVERAPGNKDHEKMQYFVEAVRKADKRHSG